MDTENRRKIADIGCGGGYYSFHFAQMNTSSKVFAIDVDMRHLEFIKK
ncbi:MAG: class I SAM-dependent methyltransferase [Culicoidibacterales bacterium]